MKLPKIITIILGGTAIRVIFMILTFNLLSFKPNKIYLDFDLDIKDIHNRARFSRCGWNWQLENVVKRYIQGAQKKVFISVFFSQNMDLKAKLC